MVMTFRYQVNHLQNQFVVNSENAHSCFRTTKNNLCLPSPFGPCTLIFLSTNQHTSKIKRISYG